MNKPKLQSIQFLRSRMKSLNLRRIHNGASSIHPTYDIPMLIPIVPLLSPCIAHWKVVSGSHILRRQQNTSTTKKKRKAWKYRRRIISHGESERNGFTVITGSTHADRYSFRQLLPLRKIPVERRFKKNKTTRKWPGASETSVHFIRLSLWSNSFCRPDFLPLYLPVVSFPFVSHHSRSDP